MRSPFIKSYLQIVDYDNIIYYKVGNELYIIRFSLVFGFHCYDTRTQCCSENGLLRATFHYNACMTFGIRLLFNKNAWMDGCVGYMDERKSRDGESQPMFCNFPFYLTMAADYAYLRVS